MKLNSVQDVAAAVRCRRQALGLSQGQLALMAGVSRDWGNYFEGGTGNGAGRANSVDLDDLLEEYRDR